ncbi:MAG TPA: YceI family protein [Nocardia sp.]|uniref:YceI family protein n=1 Tax=Nocardia TaxID=1817 RepID=UPI002457EB6F|nr:MULTISPECIES: YceI family protein [Nocardia]HLS79731.1 YceI family protein [Nocardia sp.]
MTTSTNETPTLLKPGSWELDSAHSSVAFSIRHLGIAKVRGRFTDFETEFRVDDTGAATIGATIRLNSFDTGNPARDEHVRAADFLDVANRPTLTFRASGPVRIGEEFTVPGEVTIGERSTPVTLEVEWGGIQELPGTGVRHAGFSAVGTVDRLALGVGAAAPGLLGNTVKVELEIQLIEPA